MRALKCRARVAVMAGEEAWKAHTRESSAVVSSKVRRRRFAVELERE